MLNVLPKVHQRPRYDIYVDNLFFSLTIEPIEIELNRIPLIYSY